MSQKPFRSIKDIFYEARARMGRQHTLKRFAQEVLGGAIDPVMLGYIETGQRLPSPAVVRKLAEATGRRADSLLAVLARDRWSRAFQREMGFLFGDEMRDQGEAVFAHAISRAVAALPADGSWVTSTAWRKRVRQALGESADQLDAVIGALQEQGLSEERRGRVRRKGRHFVAATREERHALAMEYAGIFAKGMLDKLILADGRTYLRNHYLDLQEERLPEFQRALDTALRELVDRFAVAPGRSTRFVKVLVASTPTEEES